MDKIKALLGTLFGEDGEPEGFADALAEAFNEDTSPLNAKIAELTESLTGKDSEIADVLAKLDAAKAHNYDLMQSLPADNGADTGGDSGGADEDSDPDVDDLFEN